MNLRKIRKEKGITQEQLANQIGAKRTRITNYETGYREPNLETLRNLATALEVTVDELIGDDDNDQCDVSRVSGCESDRVPS